MLVSRCNSRFLVKKYAISRLYSQKKWKMVIDAHAVISQFQNFFHDFILDVTRGKMKNLTFSFFSHFQIPPRSLSHNIFERASLAADAENSIFCVFLAQHLPAETTFLFFFHETCSSTSRQKTTIFYIKNQWFINSVREKK